MLRRRFLQLAATTAAAAIAKPVLAAYPDAVAELERIVEQLERGDVALDKSIEITAIRLLEKTGGKSGDYRRNEDPPAGI